jgi:hypothetical protein
MHRACRAAKAFAVAMVFLLLSAWMLGTISGSAMKAASVVQVVGVRERQPPPQQIDHDKNRSSDWDSPTSRFISSSGLMINPSNQRGLAHSADRLPPPHRARTFSRRFSSSGGLHSRGVPDGQRRRGLGGDEASVPVRGSTEACGHPGIQCPGGLAEGSLRRLPPAVLCAGAGAVGVQPGCQEARSRET